MKIIIPTLTLALSLGTAIAGGEPYYPSAARYEAPPATVYAPPQVQIYYPPDPVELSSRALVVPLRMAHDGA